MLRAAEEEEEEEESYGLLAPLPEIVDLPEAPTNPIVIAAKPPKKLHVVEQKPKQTPVPVPAPIAMVEELTPIPVVEKLTPIPVVEEPISASSTTAATLDLTSTPTLAPVVSNLQDTITVSHENLFPPDYSNLYVHEIGVPHQQPARKYPELPKLGDQVRAGNVVASAPPQPKTTVAVDNALVNDLIRENTRLAEELESLKGVIQALTSEQPQPQQTPQVPQQQQQQIPQQQQQQQQQSLSGTIVATRTTGVYTTFQSPYVGVAVDGDPRMFPSHSSNIQYITCGHCITWLAAPVATEFIRCYRCNFVNHCPQQSNEHPINAAINSLGIAFSESMKSFTAFVESLFR